MFLGRSTLRALDGVIDAQSTVAGPEPSLAAIAAPSDAVLGVFLVAAGLIRFLGRSALRALDCSSAASIDPITY